MDATKKVDDKPFKTNGEVWLYLRESGDKYIFDAVKKGCNEQIPEEIAVGIDTTAPNLLERRSHWNERTPEAFALPTEIWRETIERLQRYKNIKDKIENGENLQILTRFSEYNIKESTILVRNDIPFYVIYNNQRYDYSSAPDKMTVERIGSSFSASFVSGAMSSFHGSAAVPAGWLIPLNYVKVGRWSEGEIAKVRLIVPHSQGTVDASSSVYPCYYEITYERVN
jgi:hypothetical protein